jgi:hypothetical protein
LTLSEGTSFVSFPTVDGPRHFVFHPNGRWIYALGEESSTVTFFHYDAVQGTLALQQTISCLAAGFAGTDVTSEVVISPDGRFVYAPIVCATPLPPAQSAAAGNSNCSEKSRPWGIIGGIAHSIQAAISSMCAISAATASPASRPIARPDCFRLLGNMRRLERRRS